jgi:peptide/nickel transport system substrate-binding protein
VKPIKAFKKDGPNRVIFELEGPNADFPYILAETRTPIVPAGTTNAAFAGAVDASVLWQGDAKKAGVNIEVVKEPVDGYWDTVWNKKPWSSCFWFARVTADWMFSMAYAADAPANDMHWKHERFNKLLVEARGELDQKKRKEMYHEMQLIVRDEGGVVIPMIANMVDAASTKVKFDKPAGNQELDGLRICERWWFA